LTTSCRQVVKAEEIRVEERRVEYRYILRRI